MKLRDIAVLVGLLAALVVGGVSLTGFGAEAAERPELDVATSPADTAEPEARPVPTTRAPIVVDTEDNDRGRRRLDPNAPPPTAGTIEGRVGISATLVGQVDHFRVHVRELRKADSKTGAPPFELWSNAIAMPTTHTPRFELGGIPFSEQGYRVEIVAPNCNGSSTIVRLSPEDPFADVTLNLRKPAMFTLRVTDQRHNPQAEWAFQLHPVGDPVGRDVVSGVTDRFGTALFDELVHGPYQVAQDGWVVAEIDVKGRVMPRKGFPIALQSETIIVPNGYDLRVEVFGPAGVGLADVSLELLKTDTTTSERYEAATDFGGVYTFEFLQPGRYQLNVHAYGFQRTTRTVVIEKGEAPKPLQLRLAPTR